jgi:hypothetical protein
MLKAEKELEKEINVLIRKAEILAAQEDPRYGKGKCGSDLPEELRRRQQGRRKPGPKQRQRARPMHQQRSRLT